MPKRLVVNADDFGQSPGINRGILQAHERGIVTSASVLVRWPASVDVTSVVKTHPRLGLGLHIDLGEWGCREGKWYPLYRVLPEASESSPVEVAAEVNRQLDAFRQLAGRDPTHLDSHQHVHRDEPLRSILLELGKSLGVPVRHLNSPARYVGAFYGQSNRGELYPEGIDVESLLAILASLEDGASELCCHPAIGVDHQSPYAAERETERLSLCDPHVCEYIKQSGIVLINFRDVQA